MNTRSMQRPHRVDTHAPRKPRPPQMRVRALRFTSLDQFEVATLVCFAIGVCVLVSLVTGALG